MTTSPEATMSSGSSGGEILVLPFFGQGHLFPCIELTKHLSSRNFATTLIISSALTSSIPSSLRHHHPLIDIAVIDSDPPPPPPPPPESDEGPSTPDPFAKQHDDMGAGLDSLLSSKSQRPDRPVCAIIDVMMSWAKDVFRKFQIPVVAFFTSGACSAALEYGSWKGNASDLQPGEIRVLPGLPEDMAITYFDLKRRARRPPGGGGGGGAPGPHQGGPWGGGGGGRGRGRGFLRGGSPGSGRGFLRGGSPWGGRGRGGGPPGRRGFLFGGSPAGGRGHLRGGGPPGGRGFSGGGGPGMGFGGRMRPFGAGFRGPPGPGQRPMWVDEVEGAVAIMMNTCHELEGPFLEFVAEQIGKPVWGVGPLLPEGYWRSAGSLLHDREIRPNKQASHTEGEVTKWLDTKPPGSVIYISFGSEVGPTRDEYEELAKALEGSDQPFIWVIQLNSGRPGPPGPASGDGYYPHGLEGKVGNRGLIIRGWAPQLLILSHPSTGGFISHCGWNSTVEAIGRGVPFLAWPIRGDQYYNAKLVVKHLKTGYMVLESDQSELVKKDDIVKGIRKLTEDQGIKQRAAELKGKFENGFPASSDAAFDAFRDFLDVPPKKMRFTSPTTRI